MNLIQFLLFDIFLIGVSCVYRSHFSINHQHGGSSELIKLFDSSKTHDENDNIVFPCKPSSSDVLVDLYVYEGLYPEKIIVNEEMYVLNGRKIHFDPNCGFVLGNTNIDDIYLQAYCVFKEKDKIYTTDVFNITHIEKPTIIDPDDGFLLKGGELNLTCIVKSSAPKWFLLQLNDNNMQETVDGFEISQTIITNYTKDEETYICEMIEMDEESADKIKGYYNQVTIQTKGENDSYISIEELNGAYNLTRMVGEYVKWRFIIKSFPRATIKFFENKNNEIIWKNDDSSKIQVVRICLNRIVLCINNLDLTHNGVYKIAVVNQFQNKTIQLHLTVRAAPYVTLASKEYVLINTNTSVSCVVVGQPLPKLTWSFQPCVIQNQCERHSVSNEIYNITYDNSTFSVNSVMTFYANTSGYLFCGGENEVGKSEVLSVYYVSEIEEGIGLSREHDNEIVTVGDNVTVVCILSIHKFVGHLKWYYKSDAGSLNFSLETRVIEENSTISQKLALNLVNVQTNDTGVYTCRVNNKTANMSWDITQTEIFVNEVLAPSIDRNFTKENQVFEVYLGPHDHFYNCQAKGFPVPSIEWYKDDAKLVPSDRVQVQKTRTNESRLHLKFVEYTDSGKYTCRAISRSGQDQLSFTIQIKSLETKITYIVIICVLAVIFILLLIYLIFTIVQDHKIKRLSRVFRLENFAAGNLQFINPDLGVDEQADLLPYDEEWEFPKQNLFMGNQLGSGAFGVVMKATARSIIKGEDSTTVAVKMIKGTSDDAKIKALASELKIMVHLGKHLNVVNLLGACTKNVAKRELLVIVEYCRFGNIHNYLLRHRRKFIDQIVRENDTIDVSIGSHIINRAYSVSSSRSYQKPRFHSESSDTCTVEPLLSKSCDTNNPSAFSHSEGTQPCWRSNYRGDYDYHKDVKPITTQDLICWSFQVAKGMEYLAGRKVLHGDLAARNILLADNNIVKICDFGLAKNMYKKYQYKSKDENATLPAKWMAIESLQNGIFSTQSDVWSFGIVMWEMFTLSELPHFGLDTEQFLEKLNKGHRLKKPEFATTSLYEIMLDCWRVDPMHRPSFSQLCLKLGNYLDKQLRNQIIELNEPYTDMNNKWIEERGPNDYLEMMSSPDYNNAVSPDGHLFVNSAIDTTQKTVLPSNDTSDYLPMTPLSKNADDQESEREPSAVQYDIPIEEDFELKPLKLETIDSDMGSLPLESPVEKNDNFFFNPSYHHFKFRNSLKKQKNRNCVEEKV